MPEGDTIHRAARQIGAVLTGHVPDSIQTPQPRHRHDRWPERLAARRVESVRARGKHLLIAFEGELVLHSHLRMTGAWRVVRRGEAWGRARRRAWLVLASHSHEVVQFDGPVLELMTSARVRADPRLRALGPDVLADELDEAGFLRRLREDDPTRPIGDALLDQRTIAGLGTIWRSEACFAAQLDPWRPASAVDDHQALAAVRAARDGMRKSVAGGHAAVRRLVYGRSGRPCLRCGTLVCSRGQGEDNRLLYWCPSCQL